MSPHPTPTPRNAAQDFDLNESHELQELNCNCHQTKSSLCLEEKGLLRDTGVDPIAPEGDKLARQASLRE